MRAVVYDRYGPPDVLRIEESNLLYGLAALMFALAARRLRARLRHSKGEGGLHPVREPVRIPIPA